MPPRRGKGPNTTDEVCKFYVKGICRFGTACKYRHDAQPGSKSDSQIAKDHTAVADVKGHDSDQALSRETVSAIAQAGPSVKRLQKLSRVCFAFQAGHCRWGDACRFRHEVKSEVPPRDSDAEAQPQSGAPTNGPTGSIQASDRDQSRGLAGTRNRRSENDVKSKAVPHHESFAWRVEDLLWDRKEEQIQKEHEATTRHQRTLQEARAKELARHRQLEEERHKQEAEWTKEAVFTIQQVIVESFVKFGAGLAIQHVICGSEASKMKIRNIPIDAKQSEIVELFTQQGIDGQDIAILRTDIINGNQQVTILGRASQLHVIAVGLDGIEFGDQFLEFSVCEQATDGQTMGTNRTHQLTISWLRPFQTMIASYTSALEAASKARTLHMKELHGQRVRAEVLYDPTEYYGEHGEYGESGRSLKISQLRHDVTVQDVQNFSQSQHVRISESRYTTTEVFEALGSHLRGLSNAKLLSFQITGNQARHNSVFTTATFESWDEAKAAYDGLSGKVLRLNFPRFRLSLSDPYRFFMTMDEKQYIATQSQWDDLCNLKEKNVSIVKRLVDRKWGRRLSISLSGSDKKAIGALKVRIEGLAAGEKLNSNYWHSKLGFNTGKAFLDGLFHSTGAYVHFDLKAHCIIVHGTPVTVESAKLRIREEVDSLSSNEWTIPLQRRALGFFIREGLTKMRGLLGEDNVTLDIAAARIVLHGADLEEARHHLGQLMEAFANKTTNSLISQATDEVLCPICYDSVTQPIEIGCNHIYCTSCLRHYVFSTLDNRDFPLKCMGDEAKCNKPLSIPLIKRFLPNHRFEELLKLAFTAHIENNPELFKYCGTPGCSQVYRATPEPNQLACPSCFSEICTACHDAAHPGLTCQERRIQKDPTEQERLNEAWANDNNVKKCPSCNIWMEKTEGCNHMTCKCGKHICWICLAVFDDGHLVYDHMTAVHGGWYEEPVTIPRHRINVEIVPRAEPAVHDIVHIVGGRDAVAQQVEEYRRIQAQHAQRRIINAAPVHVPRRPPVLPPRPPVLPQRPARQNVAELFQLPTVAQGNQNADRAYMRQRQLDRTIAAEIPEDERRVRMLEQERRIQFQQQAEQRRNWCIIM